ncbi:MAG: transcription-repair coupling factor [bacterium]|nr:transcription-repair coupling factor [bacterium]
MEPPLSFLLSQIEPQILQTKRLGLPSHIKPFLLASVIKDQKTCLILTEDSEKAQQLQRDLSCFIKVSLFPETEDKETASLRKEILLALSKSEPITCIFSLPAFCQSFPDKTSLYSEIQLSLDQEIDLIQLVEKLVAIGYIRREHVEEKGELSLRGGILDVWPVNSEEPVRCEFLDDKIEGIRRFNPDTQLSFRKCADFIIWPCQNSRSDKLSIFDYLSEEAIIFLDEQEKGLEIEAKLKERRTYFINSLEPPIMPTSSIQKFYGKVETFFEQIERWLKERKAIVVCAYYPAQEKRLKEFLLEKDVLVVTAPLSCGFVIENLAVITPAEIFGTPFYPSKPEKRRRFTEFIELKIGDYAVHTTYGIGRFLGISTLSTERGIKDFLLLEYANGDSLYIPTERMDRVERYVGPAEPQMSRLGRGYWDKTKRKVKESCLLFGKELIEMEALRLLLKKKPYPKDTLEQTELEAGFVYAETDDQLKAIEDIKNDLESDKPMDRLVLGDVGFGKTEVALRAAFKSVISGFQVALLCPTTILANQHYKTFCQRMEAFPVNIGLLSRFRTDKENKETIESLKKSTIDIVIGTHRLLSKDVSFANLGLVIVDEEQRFGVAQKQRLKKMKEQMDFLSLSATPVPRTLYLSISGIRQISMINTPPLGRQSIKTEVAKFDTNLIKSAVMRELEREGQVFFVHNSIERLHEMEELLKNILPGVETRTAHGRMREHLLEKRILDFIERKFDILLSTSIIESGLDMPFVNTIIINNAQAFGLADLYQLRGRVGRTDRSAYCYLLYPKNLPLKEEQRKRMAALYEFAELGSGMRLAMSDLEIRGAGNILGEEQSGNIKAIGLGLYSELLKETVDSLRGVKSKIKHYVAFDIPYDAFIPATYIPEQGDRFFFYKRLAIEKAEKVAEEMRDRFGLLPEPVQRLIEGYKRKR